MQYTHLILGFDWRIDGEIPKPFVTLRNEKNFEISHLPLDNGFQFNWEISSERFCPGWRNLNTGELHRCKFDNILTNGYEMCPHCDRQSGFRATFFYNEEPNEHMREFLSKKQNVYLTFFQPDIIKVGTSFSSRERIRLIEQDALIARVVAEAPGNQITKIEREISRALGFTEFVNGRQKYKYIHSTPDINRANRELESAHNQVRNHFVGHEYEKYILPENLVRRHDHTINPYVFFPEPEQSLERLKDFTFITGRYRGLRNKYLLIEEQGRLLALNKKYIAQRKMRQVEEELAYESPRSVQMGLFS